MPEGALGQRRRRQWRSRDQTSGMRDHEITVPVSIHTPSVTFPHFASRQVLGYTVLTRDTAPQRWRQGVCAAKL